MPSRQLVGKWTGQSVGFKLRIARERGPLFTCGTITRARRRPASLTTLCICHRDPNKGLIVGTWPQSTTREHFVCAQRSPQSGIARVWRTRRRSRQPATKLKCVDFDNRGAGAGCARYDEPVERDAPACRGRRISPSRRLERAAAADS